MAVRGRRPGRLRSDVRTAAFVICGLAAYIALVYVVVVLVGGWLIGADDAPNLVLSIAATATVAMTFEPVQARLERAAAHRFGRRASPYEVLSRFTTTAGDGTGDDLPARMARLLAEGIGAAAAEVWLMGGERPSLAARWPVAGDEPGREIATMKDLAADGWRVLPVREGTETLGILRVRAPEHRPITAVEERLFAGLAAQAGLVLRSAQLRAELSVRLVELSSRAADLQASRERLIETQDDERRRLERDIHDGAQQNLVALAVNLRRAETLLGKAPERAAGVLAEQALAAQQAIDTLTSLARGIYPAALADEGLVPALAAVTRASALPVELAADHGIGLPAGVAAALYFACLEALQNAAKHSGGTRARIRLARDADSVYLSVSDDGLGLRADGLREGAGLANMRDRIDAVGGTLTVTDAGASGVRVDMRVPVTTSASGAP